MIGDVQGGPDGPAAAPDEEAVPGPPQQDDSAALSDFEATPGSGSDRPEALAIQLNTALEQLQRLRAEFDNYRKRTAREREEWQRKAQADLLLRLLPVLDDFARARSFLGSEDPGSPAGGMLLVLKRLDEVLANAGLARAEGEVGAEFDPERHEAVQAVPSGEIAEGHIVSVFDPGFLFAGQVLRPSKVQVSSGRGE
ncbi:MAG: nucleotide exchange factor GrpE [Candidatus Eisenbacteria bacterium]